MTGTWIIQIVQFPCKFFLYQIFISCVKVIQSNWILVSMIKENRETDVTSARLKGIEKQVWILQIWGRIGNTFSSVFSPKFSPILVKILVIWIFYWIFAKFFTNFGDIFGELKKLVSFWVTKMSPILVTIIPSNFAVFSCPEQLNRWPCHSLTIS